METSQFDAMAKGKAAFVEEGRTGNLVYNPFELNTAEHDAWDYGYDSAHAAANPVPK